MSFGQVQFGTGGEYLNLIFLTAMFDVLTIIRLIAAKNNKKNAFKIPLQFNQAQPSIQFSI